MAKAYTLGLYEKAMPKDLSWKEKMLAAKGAGFDFIEISIDETDEKLARLDMSREERLALMELMSETGVPIRTMCLSGHRKYPWEAMIQRPAPEEWRLWKRRSVWQRIWGFGSFSWPVMMFIMKKAVKRQESVLRKI